MNLVFLVSIAHRTDGVQQTADNPDAIGVGEARARNSPVADALVASAGSPDSDAADRVRAGLDQWHRHGLDDIFGFGSNAAPP